MISVKLKNYIEQEIWFKKKYNEIRHSMIYLKLIQRFGGIKSIKKIANLEIIKSIQKNSTNKSIVQKNNKII